MYFAAPVRTRLTSLWLNSLVHEIQPEEQKRPSRKRKLLGQELIIKINTLCSSSVSRVSVLQSLSSVNASKAFVPLLGVCCFYVPPEAVFRMQPLLVVVKS